MIGFQCALVSVLQMLLQWLRTLSVVVDVLEEGANELETPLEPQQRIGSKVIHVHIEHYHVLQILILKHIRSIDLGQFLCQGGEVINSHIEDYILSYR